MPRALNLYTVLSILVLLCNVLKSVMSSSKASPLGSNSHRRQTDSRRHGPAQDNGEVPLLVDGAMDDDIEVNGIATAEAQPSKTRGLKSRSQQAWHWLLKNLVVVAVACLLVAGIIALSVYFGGE